MSLQQILYFILLTLAVCILEIYGTDFDTRNEHILNENNDQKLVSELNSDVPFIDSNTNAAAEDCYCGNHSVNCEFKNGLKICTCEDGYVPGVNEVCKEKCNESNKCKNGGTCYFGICTCPPRTTGTFCEKIHVKCVSPDFYEDYSRVRGLGCCCSLTANSTAKCKYDVKKLDAYCQCPNKGEVYEDRSNTCKECNCGNSETWTKCDFYGGVKTCFCNEGYKYNPKSQHCESCNCGELSKKCEYSWGGYVKCTCIKGAKQYKNRCQKCDCGDNSFCEIREGKTICHCFDNFQEFNKTCVGCGCGKHGKCVYDNNGKTTKCECDTGYAENILGSCTDCYCGDNSVCTINVDGTKNCSCPVGYRDVNGFCTDIHECDEGIVTCPSSEVCKNIPGGAVCVCADGYRKTNNGCEDIDECTLKNPCKNKGTKCVNKAGSYECRCEGGYLVRGGDKSDLECQRNSAANVGYGLLVFLFTIIVLGLSIILYKKYRRH